MNKKIRINDMTIRKAVSTCARNLFQDTDWKERGQLNYIEFHIEKAIKECLNDFEEVIEIEE